MSVGRASTNRVAARALLLSGAFIVIVAAGSTLLINFDSAGLRGIAIGVALGLVNLVVGLLFTRRSLHKNAASAHQSMSQVTATIVGGFGIRLVLLVGLFLAFKQTSTIDAPAFGLSFVVLFFVYVTAEIVMVERARVARSA